jgi:hypothetical protein
MSFRDFLQRHGKRLSLVVNGLLCLMLTIASTIHFNSAPHPAVEAQLGTIVVDLNQLGYQLKYEDLQNAGMFRNRRCNKCDFSKNAKQHRHEDFKNPQFMGTLTRSGDNLWLHFFGKDISGGKEQLQQALNALRTEFPGRSEAIYEPTPGPAVIAPLRIDLLVSARSNARVEAELVQILEEEGFVLAGRRQEHMAGIEKMTYLGSLQHSELTFVQGRLHYWPRRSHFEASMIALRRDMQSPASDEAARQLLIRLKERLVAEYGKGRVKVRGNIP